MSTNQELLQQVLSDALCGAHAHVEPSRALEDLTWKHAGSQLDGTPHTIFQLLNHMTYWQDWTLKWLNGTPPPLPKRASMSWPGEAAPKNKRDWEKALKAFLRGLEKLKRECHAADPFSRQEKWSRLQMFQIIALHNSFHLGQLVLLRRMLGAWPPPAGGNTW